MEKLNYHHPDPRPSYQPGLRDRRWEDFFVALVAVSWPLLVLIGAVARLADGNEPPNTRSTETYRAVRSQRRALDVALLIGGASCCAIAGGLVDRVRSRPRGWTLAFTALVTACASVGLLGLATSVYELFAKNYRKRSVTPTRLCECERPGDVPRIMGGADRRERTFHTGESSWPVRKTGTRFSRRRS